ncbi:MAG: DUF4234 domain-containing protein [Planctomycetota bacterium]|jgi:hypothetical protein
MKCPQCGYQNRDTDERCGYCNQRLQKNEQIEGAKNLKKTPVILTIVFTIITYGIYYPLWFLRRKNAINNLKSEKKLGNGVFIFGIIIYSTSVVLSVVAAFMGGLVEDLAALDTIDYVRKLFNFYIGGVVSMMLFIQCFKVRTILNDHFNVHLERDIRLSGVAVFFFQIWYLQYKINRLY